MYQPEGEKYFLYLNKFSQYFDDDRKCLHWQTGMLDISSFMGMKLKPSSAEFLQNLIGTKPYQ